MPRSRFLDVGTKKSQCLLDGEPLAAVWATIQIIQNRSSGFKGRLDWNPTFYLLEEPLWSNQFGPVWCQDVPSLSNNFLEKFGEFVEEVGVKQVPKKNHAEPDRLKQ